MSRRSHTVALAAVVAFTGVSVVVAGQQPPRPVTGVRVITAGQQGPTGVTDQQSGNLLSRLDAGITTFRASFDQAINQSRINGGQAEDDIKESVTGFKQAADRLRNQAQNRRAGASDVKDVKDVLRRAFSIDSFLKRNALGAPVERDWQKLRDDLDELARAYDVAWNWSDPRYTLKAP